MPNSNPFYGFVENRLTGALLKSGSHQSYYEALGLPGSSASIESIRGGYKRASLRLHPDKIRQTQRREATDEEKAELLFVKEAYQVLCNPQRRKTYDRLGEKGLKLFEGNIGAIGGPQEALLEVLRNFKNNQSDKIVLLVIIVLFLADIVAAPILFCLKADGHLVTAPWARVWIPLWIMDVFLLLDVWSALWAAARCGGGGGREHGGGLGAQESESESVAMRAATAADEDRASDAENRGAGTGGATEALYPTQSYVDTALNFIQVMCFVGAQVTILSKMDGNYSGTWITAFIPLFVAMSCAALKLYWQATDSPSMPPQHSEVQAAADAETGNAADEHSSPEMNDEVAMQRLQEYYLKLEQCRAAWASLSYRGLWLLQSVFIALKLNSTLTWHWAVVLIPAYLYLVARYYASDSLKKAAVEQKSGLDFDALRTGLDANVEHHARAAHSERLSTQGSSLSCCTVFPAVSIILTALVLSGQHGIDTFLIFLPMWLLLSVVLIVSCCVCMACSRMDVSDLERSFLEAQDEMRRATSPGGVSGIFTATAAASDPSSQSGPPTPANAVYCPPTQTVAQVAAVNVSAPGAGAGAGGASGAVRVAGTGGLPTATLLPPPPPASARGDEID